jgi:peptide/nickel transport system permease protein
VILLQVIGKRLLQAIPVVLGVTFFTFVVLNLLPGGTAATLLGQNATPALVHELTIRLGLDHPFFVRYFHWLGSALTGNFGTSLTTDSGGGSGGVTVASIIAQRLPVTAEVGGFAFVLALVFAVPVAVLAARRPKGVIDRLSVLVSMIGFSCPQFIFALLMILIFAVHLGLVPVLGFTPISAGLWSNLHSIILPSATLGFGIFCGYARLLRADLVDQMNQEDYIITARAKGVGPYRILIIHALRNSMFGLITVVALNMGTLVGGAVIIEQIFGLPGMGQELLQAINNRDITTVQAIVTILAVSVVLANMVADILYAVLDPRIKYAGQSS